MLPPQIVDFALFHPVGAVSHALLSQGDVPLTVLAMTENQRNVAAFVDAGVADIAAALGNPAEVMRHVGMWIKHSGAMVAPVMEAIAQRAPEDFLKNVDGLKGVLSDGDINRWLQLAIHRLLRDGKHKAVLQNASVPQKHFGNAATAVIMSIAVKNVPSTDVFDSRVLREMKGWEFMDGEVRLVLQAAIGASSTADWSSQRVLVDEIFGAGSSHLFFLSPEK